MKEITLNYIAIALGLIDYLVENHGEDEAIRALFYTADLTIKEIMALGFELDKIKEALGDE
jgi:hypothetical protein